jgi:hypothetical protein
MLYRALTGGLPYVGATPMIIASAHVRKAYPSMALRAPSVKVDPALEAIVCRAMAKDPGHRFADARTMQLSLRAWTTEHLGPRGWSPGGPETQSMELESLGSRGRRMPVLLLGVLTLLAIGTSWWVSQEPEQIEPSVHIEQPRVVPAPEPMADIEVLQTHRVRVRIESEPTGAEVEFGGRILGLTPLEQTLELREREQPSLRSFRLSLDGYREGSLDLDLSVDSASGSVQLERIPKKRKARAPSPEPVSIVDGLAFTGKEAKAVLKLANESELSELQAIGIGTQWANAIIQSRPYSSIAELGAAPRVGEKTLTRLLDAVR